ncbi:DUF4350 domain-containing protein [Pontibacter arcticus]|uniref:DUF4350 domain-containing protein n=1 Tax=Pontibacter arcticus TaxID=2080288 RepID=A0A364RES0_9BACT|nr:DUF4350 domain-containing protein [Pontibacter arcticus]RAU82745.1 hypothetical protein DP923_05675 [Pontibacter arcticus]
MKGYRRYITLVVLLFGGLILLDYFRPKPVDWTRTFSSKDKIPYGTYALLELLPGIFENAPIQAVQQPIFNQLQDSTLQGNYIFINQTFNADSLDTDRLLDFVKRGNYVFIAAESFSDNFTDTLRFQTKLLNTTDPDSTGLYFKNPALQGVYRYPPNNNTIYLLAGDSLKYTRLGGNKAGKMNFMELPFGRGSFFISTVPLSFSNYALLTIDQSEYAASALSHLPVAPVLWDQYQSQGMSGGNTSVFSVLLSHEALSWAYYVALLTVILFLLFKSKRTQRIIPIIEPPRNTTLEFVNVIGNLYYNNGNHKDIAEKKITYFLEHLRLHYHVATSEPEEEMRGRVVTKSGAAEELVTRIFNLIESIRRSDSLGEQTLLMLNTYLEDFYEQTLSKPEGSK